MSWDLRVSLMPLKHCFVCVPANVAEALLHRGSSHVVLLLSTSDWQTGTVSSLLVSWDGSVSNSQDLKLSSHLWSAVQPDSVVKVEVAPLPRDITVLCVEPVTSDDWEVLELNAGYLEEQILNQLFVVSVGQVFPLWIFGKQVVTLCVKSIDCGSSGVLRPNTSFVVEPKARKTKKIVDRSTSSSGGVIRTVELRVIPADWLPDLEEGVVASACDDWRDGALLRVTNVMSQGSSSNNNTNGEGGNSLAEKTKLAAHHLTVRALRSSVVPRGCVALRAESMIAMQIRPFARVLVSAVTAAPSAAPDKVRLLVFSRKRVAVAKQWESLCGREKLVLSDGCVVQLERGLLARVEIEKMEEGFVLARSLTKAELTLRYSSSTPVLMEEVCSLSFPLESLIGSSEAIQQLKSHIFFFSLHPEKFGKLALVCGGIGAGKTALTRAVCGSVDRLYTEIVDCTTLCSEKLSVVRAVLTDAAHRCHVNFPSVLCVENLHLLCPASSDEDSSVRPLQLAHALVSLIRSGKLILVATAPSPESLNVIVLKAPTRDERREIARNFMRELQHKNVSEEMLDEISNCSDGFAAGDLRQLLQRVPRDDVSVKSVQEAKKLSTPNNLMGVKLHQSALRFADIGGLEQAKQILRETLGYPKIHSLLLSKSPIKLPTGALLYGPPGSGKTMLASAAGQEFGLNAICVSGPELLSKYIGQSEQSVRELFQRAKQCKPSLIVFDEFDSLAPKRGHDSTGVTDRVVNQLLTQLDGVEGRENVFVLAVTSRPDLIDPALLRPGRLDKLVFVNMPDERERREVLEIVCASMKMHEDVDLQHIARNTPNFSGADLQALAYNARLLVAHERLDAASSLASSSQFDEDQNKATVLEVCRGDHSAAEQAVVDEIQSVLGRKLEQNKSKDTQRKIEKTELVISRSHWQRALSEARPSVNEADRRKLAAIYGQFQHSKRGADFKAGLEEGTPKQTLM